MAGSESNAQRVVVVTGAGTGIGRAIARGFAAGGWHVVLTGRRPEPLREAAAAMLAERHLCYPCDVTERASVAALAAAVRDRWETIDARVNAAGVNTPVRAVGDIPPDEWDRLMQVNLTGAFNATRAFLADLRQRAGLVINIASIAGLRAGRVAGAAYAAAKHGMVALNHTLNEEEGEHGVRACVICPGEVDTPILEQRPEPVPAQHRVRILQPDDVAAAALFVAALPPRACVPELVIKPVGQSFR